MKVWLGDWFSWWTDVINKVVIFPAVKLTGKPGTLIVSANGVSHSADQSGSEFEALTFDDLASWIVSRRLLGLNADSVHIRFDQDRAIVRKLTAVVLPESRHCAATVLDMEASTPFRNADVHAVVVKPANGVSGTYYAIVKRSVLDPVVEAINEARINVAAMEFESDGEFFTATRSAQSALTRRPRNVVRQMTMAASLICAILIPVTFAHHAYGYSTAAAQLEQSMEVLNADAKQVRGALNERAARIAELQALRKSIQDRRPVIAIWEELARVLPDSSFLTDMTVSQDKVSIAGYSQAAASIIVALEGSKMFDEVSFTAPVVKVPGRSEDRFAIDLKIGVK